jgi:AraC-like DNA-binding protein
MTSTNQNGFQFGLEAEFLLVDAISFRPLWHHDLTFKTLNATLEAIAVDDFRCDSFKVEPPHRKASPYVVEGYHLPDPQMRPIDLLPKGVEIRTPVCASIEECLGSLKTLHERLQHSLAELGCQAAALSFHPTEVDFEGPQNKRRHDFWQWAMEAMVTYGPDVNISLPKNLAARIDLADLKYCEAALANRRDDVSQLRTKVENAISSLLPHGRVRARDIARTLGMSERTLGRRLADEGLNFAEVLQHLRRDLAIRYLDNRKFHVSKIAWLLGFQQVSAFTHACKRWTGKTPSQMRAADAW